MKKILKVIIPVLVLIGVIVLQFSFSKENEVKNGESSDPVNNETNNSEIIEVENTDDLNNDSSTSNSDSNTSINLIEKTNYCGTRWRNVQGDDAIFIDFMIETNVYPYQKLKTYKEGEIPEYAEVFFYEFSDDFSKIIFRPESDKIYRDFEIINDKQIKIGNKTYEYVSDIKTDL